MDALDLIAKIKMDISEYEEGLDKAKADAEKSGGGISGAFSKVAAVGGKVMAGFAKVTAVATGAAMAGVGALVKSSVEAYSEYEQLVGGIETLFGAGGKSLQEYADSVGKTVEEAQGEYDKLLSSQKTMLDNASNAFRTAGLSANEYMNTAIGFSGALLKSVGGDTEKAAEQTNMAITDMADQANKYGKSVQEISETYTSLARGNTQTLDNLFGGMFAGTKAGLQEMLTYAEDYRASLGETVSYSADSYADIVSAIHDVSMATGVYGTTALEASTTIQGSLGMLRSAWDNLVTGLGDKNADISALIGNVVDSLVGYTNEAGEEVNGFLDNILPVVENALSAIGTLVQELVPKALDIIPGLITDVLPKLTEAATELVKGLVSALSDNMDTISSVISQVVEALVKLLPDIISLGGQIATTLGSAIMDNLDTILKAAGQILETLLSGVSQNTEKLVSAAVTIIEALAGFISDNANLVISSVVSIAMALIQGVAENAGLLISLGLDIIMAIAQAILDNIDVIIQAVPTIINGLIGGLVAHLPDMVNVWIKLMDTLEIALPQIVDSILAVLPQLLDTIVNYFLGPGLKQTLKASITMFNALVKAAVQIGASVIASIGMLVRNAASTIAGEASYLLQAGQAWFGGLLSGVTNKISEIKTKVTEFLTTLGTSIYNTIKEKVDAAKNWGSDLINNFVNGLKAKWESVKGAVTEVANIIKRLLHFSEPDEGPLKDFHTYAPDMMNLFIKGINDNKNKLYNAVTDAFDFQESITSPELNMMATTTLKGEVAGTSMESSEPTNLTVNVITELDSEVINKKSYKYTLNQLGADTRALKVATGGY